jgi:hypothetical protein
MTQVSPAWRETRIFNMRVQPLLLLIQKWPWLSSPITHGILRSVWLLDNQSTFDLCCNPDFAHKRQDAKRAMHMSSNGGGLRISKECKVPGYDFWVWFTKRAMTNILCLKNLIRLYRVMYDSERQTAFIVHREEFGLPNMVFDMHPCGLHVYYPEKIDGQYGFVQTVADNMLSDRLRVR